ncbi:TRAP-type C4-dicarboxylate transport system permease small subunit [Paracoccus pantotrophus]|uniref:TRAP transporter small permease protein n=1 Tax=Paracoccus pantotrophus TaxID=82367 RepID=A0AAE6TUJ9_PARPN|nr:TRAP transporter small permease [Paracoccus pantotrophus]QFG37348.1 TRAP transporter small permease [Paracoccus pantotrophus]RKS52213.1 TRAP-type C4-dicarboxylate transport system permease small subunit [Paracoccus pantotrophus]
MVRAILHRLYLFCGYAAATFLAGIAVATLCQVVGRQLGMPIETTELSGFFLAASTFLGLAYTFVNGGHVRVEIIAQLCSPSVYRWFQLWCCAIAALITAYAALHTFLFALETWRFGELSPGMLAMPLWLPQAAISFGLAVMCLGIIEQATLVWAGRTPGYEANIDSTGE